MSHNPQRADVWVVNKRQRLVCVPYERSQLMIHPRVNSARLATAREIEAHLSKSKRNAAPLSEPASPLRAEIDEIKAAGDAGKLDESAYVVPADEAEYALKDYDTKAKLIALAAAHDIEGVSDAMKLAEIKSALLDAVMTGAIPYEAL